jgi:hypothetical protein
LINPWQKKAADKNSSFENPLTSASQSTDRLKISAFRQCYIQKSAGLIGAIGQNFASFAL